MTKKTHFTSWIAVSLMLHAGVLLLLPQEFLHAEKSHPAEEITLLSLVEEKKQAPPPQAKPMEHKPAKPKKSPIAKKTPPRPSRPAALEPPSEPITPPVSAPDRDPVVANATETEADREAVRHTNSDLIHLYASQVRQRIETRKTYPRHARSRGMEGVVRLRFVLSPSGEVKEITIIQGSRFTVLNTAAKNAVLSAAPFPFLPDQLAQNPLCLEVTLNFELT